MTKDNTEDGDYAPRGFLWEKYHQWCEENGLKLINPKGLGGPHPKEYLAFFFQHVKPEFFKDIFEIENQLIIKSIVTSQEYRNQGNKEYQKRLNEDALDSYTKALQFALPKSEALALAFANRSAVLSDMGHFQPAIRDINRALHTGNYPKRLLYKLYERKGRCCQKLSLPDEAMEAFVEAISSLELSDLTLDKKEILKDSLQTLINNVQGYLNSTNRIQSKQEEASILPLYKTKLPSVKVKNSRFPNLIDAVDIVYNEQVGRHGVANRDIQAGEVICVQDPPVSRLCHFRRGRNCSNCFECAIDWLPSTITNQDVFCSELCEKEAMSTFHPIEAKFDYFINEENSIRYEWLLALRGVTQKTPEFFTSLSKRIQNFSKTNSTYGTNVDANWNDDFVYDDSDYEVLLNFVTLNDKVETIENHFKAFVAAFFVLCLRQSGFFKSSKSADTEMVVGEMLLQLMSGAAFNSHDVNQYEAPEKGSWFYGTSRMIGNSLNPTLAMLNHSCDPNSVHYNIAKATVSIATRRIKKGEEVVECYFGFYGGTCYESRQDRLQCRFKFECSCPACKNIWPVYEDMTMRLDSIGIMGNSLKISSDQDKMLALRDNISAIQMLGSAIEQQLVVENYQRLFDLYVTLSKLLYDTFEPPHQLFAAISRNLYKCMWIRWGSKKRLPVCNISLI